ncbi:MAG: hypothetical protein REJ23_05180 [Brevundimonas sp.]|nr:hypothetical protein [Brevundimonas sp.]
MAISAKPKRPIAGPAAAAVVFGLTTLIGLVIGIASVLASDVPGWAGLLLSFGLNALGMIGAMVLCVWWWRRIDEAAREAHKWAWWWGGCFGLAGGGAVLLTALSRDDSLDLVGLSQSNILAAGMTLMMLCLVTGYTIAWVVWWAQRR